MCTLSAHWPSTQHGRGENPVQVPGCENCQQWGAYWLVSTGAGLRGYRGAYVRLLFRPGRRERRVVAYGCRRQSRRRCAVRRLQSESPPLALPMANAQCPMASGWTQWGNGEWLEAARSRELLSVARPGSAHAACSASHAAGTHEACIPCSVEATIQVTVMPIQLTGAISESGMESV